MTIKNAIVMKRILFLGLSSGIITGPAGTNPSCELCGR